MQRRPAARRQRHYTIWARIWCKHRSAGRAALHYLGRPTRCICRMLALGGANMTSAAVIIPVYNGAPFLERCLEALLSQQSPSFEVIAVDNGSSDGSAELLATR